MSFDKPHADGLQYNTDKKCAPAAVQCGSPKGDEMKVLVADVGGTNIKLKLQDDDEVRKFASGPALTPQQLIQEMRAETTGWKYDRLTIGFPAPVLDGKVRKEPVNLGPGWVDFDFSAALGKPVQIINDAAMQALGSYEGGRMLFLGLGTGLGSAMIVHHVVLPMELGHLPYKKGRSFEEYVGQAGMKRMGRAKWQFHVADVVAILQHALLPEYVVLGGGNVKKLDELPPGCRMGDNNNAFLGGLRIWQDRSVKQKRTED
jgi:polyphosphate glucokinase